MYIETVPNRTSPPAVLLRVATREGKKVHKRTVANISHWPPEQIEALRRVLRGERLVSPDSVFTIERSLPHGHVDAVLTTMRRLGIARILGSTRCRERDVVEAMIAERLLHPGSKLATARTWSSSTLGQELSVDGVDVDELYAALEWLLKRQERIEAKLARRHLREGDLALYDVSSSSYEGTTCPLARRGHNRDGEKLPCIVYGMLADREGRPIAVEVFPGNTGDPATVPAQVERLQGRFKLSRMVLVGDRGMLTKTQIQALRAHPGLGWISALRGPAIRALVESGAVQMSLFDERNLAEISSPEYPGERLIVCFNPLLAHDRRRTREELLAATEAELSTIARAATRRTRTPLSDAEIGVKVGRVINHYKVAKHFQIEIANGRLAWSRRQGAIDQEAALDGIYVVRTSEPAERMTAADVVRGYKSLATVERAFRCLKGLDLRVRPIYLRLEDHVRGHLLVCMLAYYVEWHMRQALTPLLFHDEELDVDRKRRDPVDPAQPSQDVCRKKKLRVTADGLPLHSFGSLLIELSTRYRNICRLTAQPSAPAFEQLTEPTPLQRRASELLETVPMYAKG
jgi:transposase